jgi:hypothetical protein
MHSPRIRAHLRGINDCDSRSDLASTDWLGPARSSPKDVVVFVMLPDTGIHQRSFMLWSDE